MRRTKIVCTLGPATNDVETMKKLIKSGLDAARINFSHGTYESHGETIAKLKQAREEMDAPIPLILDTKGPEIRIRTFAEGKIHLEVGDKFTLTTKEVEGDRNMVSVTYKDMPNDLQRGSRVLLDDGLIELQVESVEAEDIHCVVANGGNLSSNKGVNIPGIKVNLPSLTEKDISDLKFGVENGFDIVAASFIRRAADVTNIRRILEDFGGENIQIISKIENQEGIDNLDGILEAAREAGDFPVEEQEVLALLESVKASIPALVEHMKDTRPEAVIHREILEELRLAPEEEPWELTDSQWEQLRELLPSEKSGRGRAFKSNRLMLDGILYWMRSGAAWKDLPARYGRHKCVSDRLRLWTRTGVWEPVLQKLVEIGVLDETSVRRADEGTKPP